MFIGYCITPVYVSLKEMSRFFKPTGLFFVRQRNFEKQLENLENDLNEYWDEYKNKEEKR